ncbi:MAG TPA: GNAT family N-acetyltransferase [Micromonosporaceae bacterium]
MVQLTTRERVDEFWSGTLGVAVAELHRPGVRVFANPPDREQWRGIYALAFDKAVSVFVPTDLIDRIAAVADLDADAVLTPATWLAVLGDTSHTAFGPVLHHYRDHGDGLAELAEGRRINPLDAAALSAFRSAIDPDEWLSAGFTAQPAMLFGRFEGDQMVAAANLTAGPDAATDVGIVIHPEARGKGYGVQIAALAAAQALRMHGVARFRALASSRPMVAIANRLGFVEYGRNLAVYFA